MLWLVWRRVPTERDSILPIWTLEARGNMLLASMSANLEMSPAQMRREIARAHSETVSVLRRKGVNYGRLRSSLEPSRTRGEVALIFDIDKMSGGNYATIASRQIVPALREDAFHSVLQGDLIGGGPLQAIHALVVGSIVASATFDRGRVGFYYVVYLNNLTKHDVERLHSHLDRFPAYAGYVPCTYGSYFRSFASHLLSASYLKAGKIILSGHEDDVSEDQDWHLGSWDWERFDYVHRSVAEYRHGLFLSYKIERESDGPSSDDERFSLNAISDRPSDVSRFTIEIAANKLEYLKKEKAGVLKRLGLDSLQHQELAEIIKDRLHRSYFYNLRYRNDYDVSLFNILLELRDPRPDSEKVYKVIVGFRYEESQQRLQLTTFY